MFAVIPRWVWLGARFWVCECAHSYFSGSNEDEKESDVCVEEHTSERASTVKMSHRF